MKVDLFPDKKSMAVAPHYITRRRPAEGSISGHRRHFLLPLICFIWGITLPAALLAQWGPGTASHQFLKLGVGARAVAMGNAFTAVADDPTALYWNPAGLANVQRVCGTLMIMKLLDDVNYYSGGLVIPTKQWGHYGADFMYLVASDVYRDDYGREGATFENSEKAGSVGWGMRLMPKLAVGGSARIIRSQLESYTSWAASFDAGILYQPYLRLWPWKYFHLGAAIKNLGTGSHFIANWAPPPLALRCGGAAKFPIYKHRLTLASDIEFSLEKLPVACLGGEFMLDLTSLMKNVKPTSGQPVTSGLALRGGYQTGLATGQGGGLTYGLGLEMDYGGMFFQVDIVQLSYGYLGAADRASMSVRF